MFIHSLKSTRMSRWQTSRSFSLANRSISLVAFCRHEDALEYYRTGAPSEETKAAWAECAECYFQAARLYPVDEEHHVCAFPPVHDDITHSQRLILILTKGTFIATSKR